MLTFRACKGVKADGTRCQAPPVLDGEYCFWHDPEHRQDAAEARRLGGLRRRREATLAGAYDLGELDGIAEIRRLVRIAVLDTLGLDNSVARNRAIGALAQVSMALLEKGELADRLGAVEAALGPRLQKPEPKRRRFGII